MAPPSEGGDDDEKGTAHGAEASSSEQPDPTENIDIDETPDTGWVSTLKRADHLLAKGEEYALSLFLLTLISVGVYQAVKRNFFPPAAWWPDEIIRYSTFCIGLIGAALATQSSRLISIDMLTRMFSPRGRLILRIVTGLFTISVCYLFFRGGLLVRESAGTGGEVTSPHTVALVMPIAAMLIAIHIVVRVVIDVHYLSKNYVPPELMMLAPKE